MGVRYIGNIWPLTQLRLVIGCAAAGSAEVSPCGESYSVLRLVKRRTSLGKVSKLSRYSQNSEERVTPAMQVHGDGS